jgi:CheY-like chemotaxis protein
MGSHCIAPSTSQLTPPDASEQLATITRSSVRVLLIEDNEEAAALVQFWLADESDHSDQIHVEWAKTVLDAMTRLAQPGIEVVLLDLGLPELSGHRSFRAIESVAGDKIPIVILTADERPLSRDLTLGFGASDYLVKDKISPGQLRQALRNAVLRGRPHHFYRVLDTPSTP